MIGWKDPLLAAVSRHLHWFCNVLSYLYSWHRWWRWDFCLRWVVVTRWSHPSTSAWFHSTSSSPLHGLCIDRFIQLLDINAVDYSEVIKMCKVLCLIKRQSFNFICTNVVLLITGQILHNLCGLISSPWSKRGNINTAAVVTISTVQQIGFLSHWDPYTVLSL